MLQIAYISGYSLSVLVFGLLVSTLLIKAMRTSREREYAKVSAVIEPHVDDFVLGQIDAEELMDKLKTGLMEESAVFLLLKRLSLLIDKEALRITEFLESTLYIQKLAGKIKRGNKWKRARAAYLIGRTRGNKYLVNLIQLLGHKNTTISLAASAAIARIGDINAIPHLLDLIDRIDQSKAHIVSDHLIEVTVRNHEKAVSQIMEMLDSPKEHLRYWGCVILGESHVFRAIDKLKPVVKDSSSEVRSAAIQALGKIGDIDTYEFIAFGLIDPDWKVRLKSAWALGELKSPASITALTRAVMDRQWEVNTQAVKSLIATDTSLKSFIRLLQSDYDFVRKRAAEALEITGYMDKSLEKIGSELTDKEQKREIDTLLSCAKNGALMPFHRNLNSSNTHIKNASQNILKEVKALV